VRWRPTWHAERELEDRTALHLPPAARLAALTGTAAAVHELLALTELPAGAEVLGPVPVAVRAGDEAAERLLVRVPRRHGAELAAALHAAAAVRSARKSAGAVRIELDPAVIA
jgi:primosomal protein N' (replication factor Y) (superfamily II helicase)